VALLSLFPHFLSRKFFTFAGIPERVSGLGTRERERERERERQIGYFSFSSYRADPDIS